MQSTVLQPVGTGHTSHCLQLRSCVVPYAQYLPTPLWSSWYHRWIAPPRSLFKVQCVAAPLHFRTVPTLALRHRFAEVKGKLWTAHRFQPSGLPGMQYVRFFFKSISRVYALMLPASFSHVSKCKLPSLPAWHGVDALLVPVRHPFAVARSVPALEGFWGAFASRCETSSRLVFVAGFYIWFCFFYRSFNSLRYGGARVFLSLWEKSAQLASMRGTCTCQEQFWLARSYHLLYSIACVGLPPLQCSKNTGKANGPRNLWIDSSIKCNISAARGYVGEAKFEANSPVNCARSGFLHAPTCPCRLKRRRNLISKKLLRMSIFWGRVLRFAAFWSIRMKEWSERAGADQR